MAIFRVPILGPNIKLESPLFKDLIDNQTAFATDNTAISQQLCIVMADGAADAGIFGNFEIPQNYSSAPKIVFQGIIDGTASSNIGLGVEGIVLADNETADVAWTGTDVDTIAAGGYTDEDIAELTITLSNWTTSTFNAGEMAFFRAFADVSAWTSTAQYLLTNLLFEYSDV